nr:uncharacterized protein LOC127339025 [Lolium perenne]
MGKSTVFVLPELPEPSSSLLFPQSRPSSDQSSLGLPQPPHPLPPHHVAAAAAPPCLPLASLAASRRLCSPPRRPPSPLPSATPCRSHPVAAAPIRDCPVDDHLASAPVLHGHDRPVLDRAAAAPHSPAAGQLGNATPKGLGHRTKRKKRKRKRNHPKSWTSPCSLGFHHRWSRRRPRRSTSAGPAAVLHGRSRPRPSRYRTRRSTSAGPAIATSACPAAVLYGRSRPRPIRYSPRPLAAASTPAARTGVAGEGKFHPPPLPLANPSLELRPPVSATTQAASLHLLVPRHSDFDFVKFVVRGVQTLGRCLTALMM